jgi:hypothetical protein
MIPIQYCTSVVSNPLPAPLNQCVVTRCGWMKNVATSFLQCNGRTLRIPVVYADCHIMASVIESINYYVPIVQ